MIIVTSEFLKKYHGRLENWELSIVRMEVIMTHMLEKRRYKPELKWIIII